MKTINEKIDELSLNENLGEVIEICDKYGTLQSERFVKRVSDNAFGICIYEKRYLIENIEVIIRYYEKQIKPGITDECYNAYGFDVYVFKS